METAENVLAQVYQDLRNNGISMEEAARRLKYKTRQTLYNTFSRKEYFKPEQAKRFADEFGYSVEFLMYGEGTLFKTQQEETDKSYSGWDRDVSATLLYISRLIITMLGDKDAKDAWTAINNGNYDAFVLSMNQLADKHGFSIMKNLIPYKAARETAERIRNEMEGRGLEELAMIDEAIKNSPITVIDKP